ncbi:MAG: hypothetical protein DIU71_01980 [Proteobacteria bacterium]|nr:MAG: hypothetical protein DIU71_01980 [Pseudomonadota bacterium]
MHRLERGVQRRGEVIAHAELHRDGRLGGACRPVIRALYVEQYAGGRQQPRHGIGSRHAQGGRQRLRADLTLLELAQQVDVSAVL